MGRYIGSLLESLIRNIGGGIGRKIRYNYYKEKFKSCGKNVIIGENVFFENPKCITIGDNVWVDRNTILIGGAFNSQGRKHSVKGSKQIAWGELIVSNGVHIAPFCVIQAHGGVKIGKNVTVASGSKIYSLSHHYRNLDSDVDKKRYSFSTMAPQKDQFLIIGNVIIEDNAAIGLNSVILPGSIVPEGTWVSALSILNKELTQHNAIYTSQK